MHRYVRLGFVSLPGLTAGRAYAAQPAAGDQLTLAQITANPDWIAVTPENPYWGAGGNTFYFWLRKHQAPTESLHAVDLTSGKVSAVPDADWSRTGSDRSTYNPARTKEFFGAHDGR